jgi:hypothetical protein
MNRSDFLKRMGGGAIAALAGGGLSACKSSYATPSDLHDKRSILAEGEFTSTRTLNHTHTVVIRRSDVLSPDAAGISTQTSYPSEGYSSVHTHAFAMTQAQLTAVSDSTPQTIETGSTNAGDGPHTHSFTIEKWWS